MHRQLLPPLATMPTQKQTSLHSPAQEVSDEELLQVIADFLAMGHVENIIAMFRQEPRYFAWTGQLLTDERFAVRLGVSVLFEQLVAESPDRAALAIPSLVRQLNDPVAWVRGEAASVLGIIGTEAALSPLRPLLDDPVLQVAEVVRDILESSPHG